jgi:hypothetical protein
MIKTPLFKRESGVYAGFIYRRSIFDVAGRYLGWVEQDGSVWQGQFGAYWGELVGGVYLLRDDLKIAPPPKAPKLLPLATAPLFPPPPNRDPRNRKSNWTDVL